jgi:phospholipid transport system substrate-binding protein
MKKFLITLSLLFISTNSFAAQTPKEFAESVADKVVAIIEAPKSEEAREDDLVHLFKQNVDSDYMGRFAMGKYFRQATPAQQKKYLSLYRDYVIYSYIPKFRLYAGEKMSVIQTIQDDAELFTVKTTLKTTKSATGSVFVDYKLKKAGGTYKIVDVIGEGISLITTQRSDFSTPLSDRGVEWFVGRLEEKVIALKANPPKTDSALPAVSKTAKN